MKQKKILNHRMAVLCAGSERIAGSCRRGWQEEAEGPAQAASLPVASRSMCRLTIWSILAPGQQLGKGG